MEFEELQALVRRAIDSFQAVDRHLLDHDLTERCIASRLAFHLQYQFPAYCVDVEYNRKGADAKRLAIPEECANAFDHLGRALVVPDIIVHRRGPDGPNLLGLELKKIDDPRGPGCDRQRIRALKEQLQYEFGAFVECETRLERGTFIRVAEWV
jgi:hypothetical protein